jgi:Phage tail lysozyme
MSVPAVAITSAERYVQKGLSKDAACAIVSVLYAGESGLNPGPQPGTSGTDRGGILFQNGAMGIASWNGPRQTSLANYALRKKVSPWDLNAQLDFVLTECANSYPEVWKCIKSQASYGTIIQEFVEKYENPKNPVAEIEKAVAFARQLYPHVSSAPVVPQPVPVPVPGPVTQVPQMNPLLVQLITAAVEGLMAAFIKNIQNMPQVQSHASIESIQTPVPQFDPSELAKIIAQELQHLVPTMPKQ